MNSQLSEINQQTTNPPTLVPVSAHYSKIVLTAVGVIAALGLILLGTSALVLQSHSFQPLALKLGSGGFIVLSVGVICVGIGVGLLALLSCFKTDTVPADGALHTPLSPPSPQELLPTNQTTYTIPSQQWEANIPAEVQQKIADFRVLMKQHECPSCEAFGYLFELADFETKFVNPDWGKEYANIIAINETIHQLKAQVAELTDEYAACLARCYPDPNELPEPLKKYKNSHFVQSLEAARLKHLEKSTIPERPAFHTVPELTTLPSTAEEDLTENQRALVTFRDTLNVFWEQKQEKCPPFAPLLTLFENVYPDHPSEEHLHKADVDMLVSEYAKCIAHCYPDEQQRSAFLGSSDLREFTTAIENAVKAFLNPKE